MRLKIWTDAFSESQSKAYNVIQEILKYIGAQFAFKLYCTGVSIVLTPHGHEIGISYLLTKYCKSYKYAMSGCKLSSDIGQDFPNHFKSL